MLDQIHQNQDFAKKWYQSYNKGARFPVCVLHTESAHHLPPGAGYSLNPPNSLNISQISEIWKNSKNRKSRKRILMVQYCLCFLKLNYTFLRIFMHNYINLRVCAAAVCTRTLQERTTMRKQRSLRRKNLLILPDEFQQNYEQTRKVVYYFW